MSLEKWVSGLLRSFLVQSKFGGKRDTVGQAAAKPYTYSHCTSSLSPMRIPCMCIIHDSRHRYSMCTHAPGTEGAISASGYIIIIIIVPKFQLSKSRLPQIVSQ